MSPSPDPEQALKVLPEDICAIAPMIVVVLSPTATIQYVNPYFEKLTGWEAKDVVGRDWIDTCIPERHRAEIRALFNVATHGTPTHGNTNPICTPDGREISIEWSDGAKYSSDGELEAVIATGVDVTQRLQREFEVREERSKLSQFLNSLDILAGILDLEGNTLELNTTIERAGSATRTDSIGVPLCETFGWSYASESRELARDLVTRAARGETARSVVKIRWTEDEYRMFDATFGPLYDDEKSVVGIVASCVDTTARIEAEIALERQKERLLEAQRIAKIGSWVLDHRTGRLEWSDEVYRVFGIEPGLVDPTYGDFLELCWPDDRQAIDEAYTRSLETKRPYEIVHRTALPAGAPKWVQEQCETIVDTEGLPVISRGTVQDISQQRATQLELADSEAALRAVLEFSGEAIIVIDTDGLIRSFSSGAERLFGIAASDALNQNYRMLISGAMEAPFEALFEQVVHGATASLSLADDAGLRARRQGGVEFPVDISISRSPGTLGSVLTLVIRDATERQAHDARMESARLEAERASQAKSAFLATMSHEIRTPLNSLMGVLSVLERDQLGAKQAKMVSVASQSSFALMSVLNDILDYSKIEAGEVLLEEAAFEPHALLERVCEFHRGSALEKGLALEFEKGSELPPSLIGSWIHIERVLNNLMGNAIKFTHDGEVSLRAEFKPSSATTGDLTLTVHDSGIGMTLEQQAHIFDRFVQADSSMTRRYGGSGLGLSIAAALVQQMGGTIEVRSEAGSGSDFTVSLPLQRGGENLRAPEQEQSGTALPEIGPVLVIEDEPLNRAVLEFMLNELGCDFDLAGDGRTGLEYLRKRRYDVVLMDIQMPGLDGEETLRELRRQQRERGETPSYVIAATAFVHDGRIQRYTSLGFDDVLPKPIQRQALSAILAAAAPE